jgi:hypothetical protein
MGLFDMLKKKNAEANADVQPSQTPNPEPQAAVDQATYARIANSMYPGIGLYARDVNLPDKLCEKYEKGMIICERGFTDATNRFMGMVTTHRYVILSNHMANLTPFEQGANWGLHVASSGAHFKVLGRHTHNGKTGIFLLHLPDNDDWKVYLHADFSLDAQLFDMAVQRFIVKCNAEPVPELTKKAWLDRCALPLGMTETGKMFDL